MNCAQKSAYSQMNDKNLILGMSLAGAGFTDIGDYNTALLRKVVDCCCSQNAILTANQYKYIVRSICHFDRPQWQKNCENAILAVGSSVRCAPCSDVFHDAAASIVLAEFCAMLDEDNNRKFDLASIRGSLICQLKCCGIECLVSPNANVELKQLHIDAAAASLKGSLNEKSKSLGSNKKNAELALLSMGKYAGNTSSEELGRINFIVAAAQKTGSVLTPSEFENEFAAAGVKRNASMIAIHSFILKLAGKPADALNLSGVYPVSIPWSIPFPYGVDRETNSDMRTSDNSQMSIRGLGAKESWDDFGVSLAQGLIKDTVAVIGTVVKQETLDKFKQNTNDAIAKEVANTTGVPAGSVTQDQIGQWAKDNPSKAADIAENSAQKSGMSPAELDLIKQAIAKNNNPTNWTKIAIYGGIGIAALAAIGVTVVMLRRK